MPNEEQLIEERKRKRDELSKLKINPYPYRYETNATAEEIKEKYESLPKDSMSEDNYRIAGRIMELRRMGKITFMKLQDQTGKMQVFFSEETLGKDKYKLLKLFDVGDFLGVEGKVFTTKTGEITIKTEYFDILSKSLRPLPEKWHGLKDKELRYRKRYLDLIVNPEIKEVFRVRNIIISEIRDFLTKKGFIEVETPVLQALYGGTNAKPFKTYFNEFKQDVYLRLAPELYLKRLVVGGFEKVFEIGKNFRNESADLTHNPEFTMLEFYEAYADYDKMMDTAEALYKSIAKRLYGDYKIPSDGKFIDLNGSWPRIPMTEAIKKHLGLDVEKMSMEELKEFIDRQEIEYRGQPSKGIFINAIFEKLITPKLEGPLWIVDYPKEVSPLSKPHRSKKDFVERFECYAKGREIGDGWSEIINPTEQRDRFEKEQAAMRAGDVEAHPLDEDFIESLEYGMPVLGGIGIGIDRLVMFFTNKDSIRDVMLFPFMKPIKE